MSTKIYHGLRSDKPLNDVYVELMAFRDKYVFSGKYAYIDPKEWFSTENWGTMDRLNMNPRLMDSCLIIIPSNDYVLCYPAFDDSFLLALGMNFEKCVELLIKETSFVEYGYWDNTNQPDDVSDEDWADRCEAWSVVGYKAIEYYGLVFKLSNINDFINVPKGV